MSKLQGATAQQSTPLWDRNKNERGHLTSVDKAVAAHRMRVSERLERSERRIAAATDINDRFFPKPAVQVQQASQDVAPFNSNPVDSYQDYQQDYVDYPMQPEYNEVQEIYQDLNMSPVREHAVAVLNKDADEVSHQQIDEDVPKGSYIDRMV